MFKTFVLVAALTVTPVNTAEKLPDETVTITKALAEKLVQSSVAQQQEIAQLKQDIYQYQMMIFDMRSRMCA